MSLSVTQMKSDPLPEQPNQYNRVCDLVAKNNLGCKAQLESFSLAQKKDPLPEQPNQYNRVCDLVAPNNAGCKVQLESSPYVLAQSVWLELPTCGSAGDTVRPAVELDAETSNSALATCKNRT